MLMGANMISHEKSEVEPSEMQQVSLDLNSGVLLSDFIFQFLVNSPFLVIPLFNRSKK